LGKILQKVFFYVTIHNIATSLVFNNILPSIAIPLRVQNLNMKTDYFLTGFLLGCVFFMPQKIYSINFPQFPDTTDYYSTDYIRNENYVYQRSIHAIEIYRKDFELSDPVIQLNTDERFHVGFDDFEGSVKQYYFTVQHCTAGWGKSDIWVNEFIDGMEEDQVEKFESSFNTRTSYTHYEFEFPNERFILKKSGNYILKVYTYNQKGEIVPAFTNRFLVVDPKVVINATVNRAGTADDYETKQEIDFTISTTNYRIDAPYQDIKVVILQNWRWDNALTTLKPFMVKDNVLDYNYDNGVNLFDGANEFRRFDIKSLKFLSERVREISFNDTVYNVKLWDSEKRTYKAYAVDADINGKFLLKTDDEASVSAMGEYALVKFFLPFEAPIIEGNLYVAGGYNGWQYNPDNKMQYNFRRKGYEASILFKQGYYNFLYVLLPNNSQVGDATFIEGNHSYTLNTYTILVYHRQRGELYDELIATGNFEMK